MKPTRREFLQIVAASGAAAMLPWQRAYAFYQSPGVPIPGLNWPGIAKFATPLRGAGPGGIPVARPDGVSPVTGASHYSLNVTEYRDRLHPVFGDTTLWATAHRPRSVKPRFPNGTWEASSLRRKASRHS